jgi:hypothetical protein
MPKLRVLNLAMLLATFLIVLAGAGCDVAPSDANNRRWADEAAVRARADQIQAGEAAKKALDSRLQELDLRFANIKAGAKSKSDPEIKKLQDQLAGLRAKLSDEIGRIEEWDQQKDEEAFQRIEQRLDDLGRSR